MNEQLTEQFCNWKYHLYKNKLKYMNEEKLNQEFEDHIGDAENLFIHILEFDNGEKKREILLDHYGITLLENPKTIW